MADAQIGVDGREGGEEVTPEEGRRAPHHDRSWPRPTSCTVGCRTKEILGTKHFLDRQAALGAEMGGGGGGGARTQPTTTSQRKLEVASPGREGRFSQRSALGEKPPGVQVSGGRAYSPRVALMLCSHTVRSESPATTLPLERARGRQGARAKRVREGPRPEREGENPPIHPGRAGARARAILGASMPLPTRCPSRKCFCIRRSAFAGQRSLAGRQTSPPPSLGLMKILRAPPSIKWDQRTRDSGNGWPGRTTYDVRRTYERTSSTTYRAALRSAALLGWQPGPKELCSALSSRPSRVGNMAGRPLSASSSSSPPMLMRMLARAGR